MTARVLLFTGKGGVGKTTTAASTALHLAERGHKVVVTSADPAHSLADALGMEFDAIGSRPVEVAPGCEVQQLDALERMAQSWGDIRAWLVDVFDWAGLSAVEAEELAVFPGFEELIALLEIDHLLAEDRHDVVVVDCAPTAESLRLLSMPDILDWYMQRMFPASRRLTRLVGPVLARLSDLPVAGPEVFDAGERFHRQLARVRATLTDPTVTTVRLVTVPERIVVAEARRTHTYLSLFGYHVDAVIANRLLPVGSPDPFTRRWQEAQGVELDAMEESFAPVPVIPAPLGEAEVLGPTALAAHGAVVWDGRDPLADLCPGSSMRLDHEDGRPVLRLRLPDVDGEAVDLLQRGDDLVVTVGGHRRTLRLPDSLRGRAVLSARVRQDELELTFS